MSYTRRQHERSQYRKSNPNPLIGFPSPTLSVHCFESERQDPFQNSHINNFVSVLILRDLDVFGLVPLGVLGHVVDLLLGDGFRFALLRYHV